MKLISYRHAKGDSFGIVKDGGIIDLARRLDNIPDLRELIRTEAWQQVGEIAQTAGSDFGLADIEFLPTIPNPEKIICIGVNYANRNEEYKDGSEQPKYPSVFMRTRESLVGHEVAIFDPPESDQLDYEGEIVLVIGRGGRRIAEADAHHHVAGLTIMNEGSVRDWLRHAKFNVTQGKNFARSGAMGPWLVTPDEVDPMSELEVTTRVNGEQRQNDVTANLMFPFRYLVSYLSTFYELKPGDVIATGTPNGAGARFDPPKYLKPGDTVEVEVSGVGLLRNQIEAEPV